MRDREVGIEKEREREREKYGQFTFHGNNRFT